MVIKMVTLISIKNACQPHIKQESHHWDRRYQQACFKQTMEYSQLKWTLRFFTREVSSDQKMRLKLESPNHSDCRDNYHGSW